MRSIQITLPTVKMVLLALLLVVAGIFIGRAIYHNYGALKGYAYQVSIPSLLLGILLYCGALGSQGLYNVGLIFERSAGKYNLWQMLREYFVSKLVRYIPGKVWGIYYQSERLKYFAPKQVVWVANFIQFFDANLFSCFVIFTVGVACYVGGLFASTILLILSLVFCILLKCRIVARLVQVLGLRIGLNSGVEADFSTNATVLSRFALLSFDWFFYLAVWAAITASYLPLEQGIGLGVLYAGASIIGVAVIVVPSGLFVREASFIALAVWFGFDESLATFLGIAVRLILTTADIVLGLVFTVLIRSALTEVESYEY